MGFLEEGAPLSWEASARYRDVVKRRGVREFLQLYQQFSADVFPEATLSWGDEVEYCLLNLDVESKIARLYLGAEDVLGELKTRENLVGNERQPIFRRDSKIGHKAPSAEEAVLPFTSVSASPARTPAKPASLSRYQKVANAEDNLFEARQATALSSTSTCGSKEPVLPTSSATAAQRLPWQTSSWHPEYGMHMVEAIPGVVYPLQMNSILELLPSMQVRRKKVQSVLPPNCYVASMGSFPTMGAPECRPRPCGCCVRASPSCDCGYAAARVDNTPAKADLVDAVDEFAARERRSRLVDSHGAAGSFTIAHPLPAENVTAASLFDAATASSADSKALEATDATAYLSSVDKIAAAEGLCCAEYGANDDTRPTTAADFAAAATVLSCTSDSHSRLSTAKRVEEENAEAFSGPHSHSICLGGEVTPREEVTLQDSLIAEAQTLERAAVSALETEEMAAVGVEEALSEDEKDQTAEGEGYAWKECGKVTDIQRQAAKQGLFRDIMKAKSTRMTGKIGLTAARPEHVTRHSPSFLERVGVTTHTGDFASPPAVPDPMNSRSRSCFIGDKLINPHPRFGTLTANIRARRGEKMEIFVPLFVDENTALPSGYKNSSVHDEPHTTKALPPAAHGCSAAVSYYAAEVIASVECLAASDEGAGGQCLAGAAEEWIREVGTREPTSVLPSKARAQGITEPTLWACGSAVAADYAERTATHMAGGSNIAADITSARGTYSKEEEYYRQLMREGRILHDGKHIYMDAMGFGMGMHCVQATFGCPSMRDARYLYDQLTVLAPLWLSVHMRLLEPPSCIQGISAYQISHLEAVIRVREEVGQRQLKGFSLQERGKGNMPYRTMSSAIPDGRAVLSAATPFMRGLLAAVDSRWDVIAASVDCRTPAERKHLPKSRYDTVSLYISDDAPLKQHLSFYNDVPAPVNERAFAALVENGIDEILARHMAFLFVRDPLVIFEDKLLAQKPIKLKGDDTERAFASNNVSAASTRTTVNLKNSHDLQVPTCSIPTTTTTTTTCPATTASAASAVGVATSLNPISKDISDTATQAFSPSCCSPATTASTMHRATGNPSAGLSAPLPEQPQCDAAQQVEQACHTQHRGAGEEADDDSALVAEAAAPWGINDGTVYVTTEDFENLQSTNWNSVRFKPPAAFKPLTENISAALSHSPECYGRQHSTSPSDVLGSEYNGRNSKSFSHRSSGSRKCSRECFITDTMTSRTSEGMEGACSSSSGGSGRISKQSAGRGHGRGREKDSESHNRERILGGFPVTGPHDIAANSGIASLHEEESRCPLKTAVAGGSSEQGKASAAVAGDKCERISPCPQEPTAMHEEGREKQTAASAPFPSKDVPSTSGEGAASSLSDSPCDSSRTSSPRPRSASPAKEAPLARAGSGAAPWRVEFRTPDAQLTDFENAACLSLISVLVQVILQERLDLYLPMSLNDENKRRAVECNSILRQKFWFRNDVRYGTADRSFAEFSLHEILFGVSDSQDSDRSGHQMRRYSSSSILRSSASTRSGPPCSSTVTSSLLHFSSDSFHVHSPFSLHSPCGAATQTMPCSPFSSNFSPVTPTLSVLSARPHAAVVSPASPSLACRLPLPRPLHSSPSRPLGDFSPLPLKHHVKSDFTSPADASSHHAVSSHMSVLTCSMKSGSAACSCTAPASPDTSAALLSPGAGDQKTLRKSSFLSVSSCSPCTTVSTLSTSVSSYFVGLVPLCINYIEKEVVARRCSREAAAQYLEYFDFLRHRTEGLVPTDASFLRACLAVHPAYNQDSVISAHACFDLCRLAVKLGHGELQVPELFGPFVGRAGMRVSPDCCSFDNGVPVVTISFLSRYVSAPLKAMLHDYVTEVPDGCPQYDSARACAHTSCGTKDGKVGAKYTGSRHFALPETGRSVVGAAATETPSAAGAENVLLSLHIEEGKHQGPRQAEAPTGSTGNYIGQKHRDTGGLAVCPSKLSHETVATECSAGVRHNASEPLQRGEDTASATGLQVILAKDTAASELVQSHQSAAGFNRSASFEGMMVRSEQNILGESEELKRVEVYSETTTPGLSLSKETPAGLRISSIEVTHKSSARSISGNKSFSGRNNGSEGRSCLTFEKESGAFEPTNAKAHAGRYRLGKDSESKDRGGGRSHAHMPRALQASTAFRRNSGATAERKKHCSMKPDAGPISHLQKKTTAYSTHLMAPNILLGSSYLKDEESSSSWSTIRGASIPSDGGNSAARMGIEMERSSFWEAAVGGAASGLHPIAALERRYYGREEKISDARVHYRDEALDRRIVFALSGEAAASLCNPNSVNVLRSYMSDALPFSSCAEAVSRVPAVATARGGKIRSCKKYSGWSACAPVGVTNEEATGLWLFLTSGPHYSLCYDDSGSTSCPSTDDDRESADEVGTIPRLLFSSGEVMAYSKAVLEASA